MAQPFSQLQFSKIDIEKAVPHILSIHMVPCPTSFRPLPCGLKFLIFFTTGLPSKLLQSSWDQRCWCEASGGKNVPIFEPEPDLEEAKAADRRRCLADSWWSRYLIFGYISAFFARGHCYKNPKVPFLQNLDLSSFVQKTSVPTACRLAEVLEATWKTPLISRRGAKWKVETATLRKSVWKTTKKWPWKCLSWTWSKYEVGECVLHNPIYREQTCVYLNDFGA